MFYRPDPEHLPRHLKTEGKGWHAIYNVAVPRALDIKLLHTIEFKPFELPVCVQFSPDDSILAAGSKTWLRMWRARDYRLIFSSEWDEWNIVRSLCFFPDCKKLVAGQESGEISVWDIEEEEQIASLSGHEGAVVSVVISPDGQTIYSAAQDGTVRQWDVTSSQQTHSVSVGEEYLTCLSVSSDASRLAVGVKSDVQVFDVPGLQRVEQPILSHGHQDFVTSLAYSPDQGKLASASLDHSCKIWEVGDGKLPEKLLYNLEGHGNLVLCVRWTHCGKWLLSSSKDGSVHFWDPATGNAQLSLQGHSNSIIDVSLARDGHRFATAGGDDKIRIWSFGPCEQNQVDTCTAVTRPGCGLPLNFVNPLTKHFPVLTSTWTKVDDWCAKALLIREVCMLKMVEDVTNRDEWWLDALRPDVCSRWKQEALNRDWAAYRKYGDFTTAMADACINEIRLKSEIYQKTAMVPIFDATACAVKADVSSDLVSTLKSAVSSLEDGPLQQTGQVQHLLHPSFWPLIYGRTRTLIKDTIKIENCIASMGRGELLDGPNPDQVEFKPSWSEQGSQTPSLSVAAQWLPFEVEIDSNGHASISSYINNLHPTHDRSMYAIINSFIAKSLSAWDLIYRWPPRRRSDARGKACDGLGFERIMALYGGPVCTVSSICDKSGCCPESRPLAPGEKKRKRDEMCNDDCKTSDRAKRDQEWYKATHPLFVPDAVQETVINEYERKSRFTPFSLKPDHVKTSGFFNLAPRIQVMTQLTTINLTPENPTYEGGKWHVEGHMADHICATALFFFDDDNVDDSAVGFRVPCTRDHLNEEKTDDTEKGGHWCMTRVFAIEKDVKGELQDLGSTLVRQGKAVFFPNLYLHRIMPFSLADGSRKGHRKILALHLVDPAIPIISTANVPPQQPGWGEAAGDAVGREEAQRVFEDFVEKRYVL
ncbi:WD40 repeat 2 [Ophiocordyceps camponoti-floridani]|uniref:WD40 repeat 2 n=1 Tax=Ophiocordyceps camponoti-floridani TaxID=2030778 RepID=A0A8H4Q5I4_9HYPO|nr:WD40 repeat 2 [Ophiocordyceps camponoti-floridani]